MSYLTSSIMSQNTGNDSTLRWCQEAARDFEDTVRELLKNHHIIISAVATKRQYGARVVVQWFYNSELLKQILIRVVRDSPFHYTFLHETLLSQRQLVRRLLDVLRSEADASTSWSANTCANSQDTTQEDSQDAELSALNLVLPDNF